MLVIIADMILRSFWYFFHNHPLTDRIFSAWIKTDQWPTIFNLHHFPLYFYDFSHFHLSLLHNFFSSNPQARDEEEAMVSKILRAGKMIGPASAGNISTGNATGEACGAPLMALMDAGQRWKEEEEEVKGGRGGGGGMPLMDAGQSWKEEENKVWEDISGVAAN